MTTAVSNMTPSTHRNAVGSMHQKAKYTFDQPEYDMAAATVAANANTRKHRRHQRANSEDGADPTDGSGSLTYSAASSINSAGESTDSSFADIMKVLDMQDPQELGALMKERGMTAAEYHMHLQQQALQQQLAGAQQPPHKQRSSQASVASSLQYSTDGESNFLHGTDLVSTITGQPSDSLANDGGMYNNEQDSAFDSDNILFAPADPTDSIKKRKKEKKNRSKDTSSINKQSSSSSSGGKHSLSKSHSLSTANTSTSKKSDGTKTVHHRNKTPPRIPRNRSMHATIDDDICYAEWWMSCFPDAFKEMMPKR